MNMDGMMREHSSQSQVTLSHDCNMKQNKRTFSQMQSASTAREPFMISYTPRRRIDSDEYDEERHCHHLSKLLRESCDDKQSLTTALAHAKQDYLARERQIKQDMFLQILMERDKAKRELDCERRRRAKATMFEKSRLEGKIKDIQLIVNNMEKMHNSDKERDRDVILALKTALSGERNKVANASNETMYFREALDHCQTRLKTTEDDLTELQRIGNEEKARKDKRSRGLPPAYGSLDDENEQPPWGRYEDGGGFDVFAVEYLVRDCFIRDLDKAQMAAKALRDSSSHRLRASAPAELLRACSVILTNACETLHGILEKADDLPSLTRKKQKRRHEYESDHAADFPPNVSGKSLAASRIVRLIVEFSWRILAAFDVRAYEVDILDQQTKAKTGMCWRNADDVMMRALQGAVSSGAPFGEFDSNGSAKCSQCGAAVCPGNCQRLSELQYFSTMLISVCARFDGTMTRDVQKIFSDSCTWLAENIEAERHLARQHRA